VEQSPSSCLLFPSGYKAGLDGVLDRPDVPVFLRAAEVHLGLRLPSLDVADSHPDAESWSDADRGAVRRACFDMVGAIPEDRQGHLGHLAWAAEKLAGREPRLADAVPDHPDPAWFECLGLPASVGLVVHWAQPRAAAELCTQDEALSAA
jgi:hypothetical protein